MKIEFFDEPELEFGLGGTHVDIRRGLMLHGPLDLGEATASNQVRVGVVGTSESVDGIRNWLQQCEAGIGAKKSRLNNLFPLFPGFRPDTTFGWYRTNVWNYPGANTFSRSDSEGNLLALHPTPKPVALIVDAIKDCTARGDLVLDPFLGSGTAVIASERSGRRATG